MACCPPRNRELNNGRFASQLEWNSMKPDRAWLSIVCRPCLLQSESLLQSCTRALPPPQTTFNLETMLTRHWRQCETRRMALIRLVLTRQHFEQSPPVSNRPLASGLPCMWFWFIRFRSTRGKSSLLCAQFAKTIDFHTYADWRKEHWLVSVRCELCNLPQSETKGRTEGKLEQ